MGIQLKDQRMASAVRRLLIAEPSRPGWGHASFNAAMIWALSKVARAEGAEVTVYAERDHLLALKELLNAPHGLSSHEFSWQDIPVVDGFDRTFVRKFAAEISAVWKLMVRARAVGGNLVLLSVYPNTLACIMLLRPLFRDVRLHVILHGELESVLGPASRAVWKQGFWARLAILRLFRGSWPMIYVLGEGIRRRLLHSFPGCGALKSLRAIRHPYLFSRDRPRATVNRAGYRIGFVGAGRVVKGVTAFFEIAATLRRHVEDGTMEFVIVGGLEGKVEGQSRRYVRVLSDRVAGLSASDYEREIERLDCAVMLSVQNYAFTASGSIFDAIDKGLEVFSLDNNYLGDLAALNVEGGIKFFKDVAALTEEIRRRVESGHGFARFRYPQIRAEYSADAECAPGRELITALQFDG